jgi:competence protein ComEC
MPVQTIYFWAKAPFFRLLICLIAGILLQWYVQLPLLYLFIGGGIVLFAVTSYFLLPFQIKFRLGSLNGIAINLLLLFSGALLVWFNDPRHGQDWIGRYSPGDKYVVATLEEPPVEKLKSIKALARVQCIYEQNACRKAEGKLILYFKKDPAAPALHYGAQVIFPLSDLQEIKNSGNPGNFDFRQYNLFQGITHQAFLSTKNFVLLPSQNKTAFNDLLYKSRDWVISTLRTFISGEKEQGLAEALLIGYKYDLDRDLVQSYTNTGVVHIIAISGMHLALIYGLLLYLTSPLKRRKELSWLRILLVLSALWLFTLLAGAQASVVRSAVMFTCIGLGEMLSKRTSIYNTLSLSAFLLLCYNPYWLWDVGFQLSYAAVLSIVLFYKPVYNWVYLPNKSLDFFWKTIAISIAAQILTTPVSLYHFHQFPVLFLLTNVVAVPLSTLVLFGEIALCVFSWIAPIAKFTGWLTGLMIYWMNRYIERIEQVSFSLWNGFSLTVMQAGLLLVALGAACYWLMENKKWMLWFSLCSLLAFICLRSLSFKETFAQRKIIVYNVPRHSATDLVLGRTYSFLGDTALLSDDFVRNFHLQPSRILHRMSQEQRLPFTCKEFELGHKKIIIIDTSLQLKTQIPKEPVFLLILSKNPRLYVSDLVKTFSIHQLVIDGSVPAWKARLWKHDCDSLHIPCYDVSEKGAFVMNL